MIRYEFGYFVFCKVLNLFSDDYHFLIAASSIIVFATAGYFYLKTTDFAFATVFLFITLLIDAFFMSAMRQSLAIAIAMIAVLMLSQRRVVPFVLLIVLASLFHASAIVLLILLPLSNMTFTTKSFITFLVISVICVFAAGALFSAASTLFGRYGGYTPSSIHGRSNYYGALIKATFTLVLVSISYYCITRDGRARGKGHPDCGAGVLSADFLMFMGMLTLVCNVLGMGVEVLNRMSNYFNVFLPILIPLALSKIESAKEKTIMSTGVYGASLAYFIVVMVFRPEWYGVTPYMSSIVFG